MSAGSGIGDDGGHGRSLEVLPRGTSTIPSGSVGQATTVADVLSSSSPVSTAPVPSLRDLVAAAAVARDAAAAAAATAVVAAAEARGGEATAEGGDTEATANSGGAPTMPTTATPSLPPDEIAPVSGSFPVAPVVSCCCCARNGAVGDTTQATENNGGVSSRSTATRLMEQQQRRSPPPSSSSPFASSQPPLRRLPCGHSAHEACLIPLILESVGRGDSSRCLCPLDSSPIFPALSRHRRRVCRPRPGTDNGVSAVAAAATHDHRRSTRSASSAAPPTVGGADRHARAAAARELLRRNTAAGFGFGGVNAADALGIALFGSGLVQPPPPPPPIPPPPSIRGHATATVSPAGPRPRESGSTMRTASSTRENNSGSMLRRAEVNERRDGEIGRGGDGAGGSGTGARSGSGNGSGSGSGSGPRGCKNAGGNAAGGARPRDGSLADEPILDGTALFVGGEGIVDAPDGDSGAARAAGPLEDRGGPTARRSRRRQRRTSAGVVRGSTVGSSRAGRVSGGTGRDISHNNEACASGASAADSVDRLALTTRCLATNAGKGRGAGESRKAEAAGHPSPRRGREGDERGGRESGSGRGTLAVVVVGSPSLAVGPATARGVPPAGHSSSATGMALVTAGG